jgi:RNA polymerase subunit RPABC4/transcription elongation factor Spt4
MQNPPTMLEKSCAKCGAVINHSHTFCGQCGAPVTTAALQPQHTLQPQPPVQQYQPTIQEYKRTCRSCGKTWHSLVSREMQIKRNENANKCNVCAQCGNPAAQLQATRNLDANQSESTRLRQCPTCASSNYDEVIISIPKPQTRR